MTATTDSNKSYQWTFGKLVGSPPKIGLPTKQEHAAGWGCQHVLSAVSNAVLDVNACGYQITDQAGQIADKMAAMVTQ